MSSGSRQRLDQYLLKKIRKRKPAIIRKLIRWSTTNSPRYPWREDTSPYSILVSELLLRKTRADKVSEIFPLFMKEFPTVQDLSGSSDKRLKKTIYSLGRLKRDREILAIARTIVKDYSGEIPEGEAELLRIIGRQSRYTVSAVRCFAYEQKVAVFDINVNRILSRLFSIDLGKQPHKNQISWKIAERLLPSRRFREFNWGLLDLGRTVCTRKPKCNICPLAGVCDYAKKSIVTPQTE